MQKHTCARCTATASTCRRRITAAAGALAAGTRPCRCCPRCAPPFAPPQTPGPEGHKPGLPPVRLPGWGQTWGAPPAWSAGDGVGRAMAAFAQQQAGTAKERQRTCVSSDTAAPQTAQRHWACVIDASARQNQGSVARAHASVLSIRHSSWLSCCVCCASPAARARSHAHATAVDLKRLDAKSTDTCMRAPSLNTNG